jgi:hypothetical protein
MVRVSVCDRTYRQQSWQASTLMAWLQSNLLSGAASTSGVGRRAVPYAARIAQEVRVRGAAKIRSPHRFSAHDLVPQELRSFELRRALAQSTLVHPHAVYLDVGLVENGHAFIGGGPYDPARGIDEPALPTREREIGKRRKVGQ